ncbi:relaxase/mobilization nuclease domain-containing protein [Diaminobutyricibacter tongyongensis]|uniref:Relaxase/mobilization nuclease domain-containing protein n=1 Tax=Leifsonia tongyongensis TaxID=1268043 RepID=A0A6L9XU98_9MICO|nr:relaxase/mobilization nuclease domain-containing protein [Diaminobutyricibacter tongyongensis]NEN04654.1 relaxase/mobilization nuclease domain-containing protein [Diaminobutyricibacter tongyongensis]
MAVVVASSTRMADALINYALDDKPNQRGERYVMASGVGGLLVSVAKAQMRDVRKKWGKDRPGAFVQAYHVIQSFGKHELLPEDPDSWMTAQTLGRALAEDRFPGRQTLVVTQRDGKTGCLHNHIVVNSIETRTGKSLNSSIVMHSRLVEAHERVLEAEGFEQRADLRRAFSDAQDRQERGVPSGLRRAGSVDASELHEFQRYLIWETESAVADEYRLPRNPEPFSVNVLKGCAQQAIDDPASVDWKSFVDAGVKHGVRIEQRGQKGRGISYGMMREQPDGTRAEPSASDRRRSTTLGVEYEMDAVERTWAQNIAMQQALVAPDPVAAGIHLSSDAATQKRGTAEERLRAALDEVDQLTNAMSQRMIADYLAAKNSHSEPVIPTQVPDDSNEAASTLENEPLAPPVAEAETIDLEEPAPAMVVESSPSEAVAADPKRQAAATLEEDLRKINQRNRRLGLPLVSPEEFSANRAMSPAQRKRRLEHPEWFEEAQVDDQPGLTDRFSLD